MSDTIDPAHVCASPHRKAYEAFLQLDRFREGTPFDPDRGLFGLVRRFLGTFTWGHKGTEEKNTMSAGNGKSAEQAAQGVNDARSPPKGKAELTGYSLVLPYEHKATPVEVLREQEKLLGVLLQRGGDFLARVDLTFEVRESEGPAQEIRCPLGGFPLFTPRDTLLIHGLERVPVIQLLPGPGLYLSLPGTRPERSLLLRPSEGPALKIRLVLYRKGGFGLEAQALGERCKLASLLSSWGIWEEVLQALAGREPDSPLLPLPRGTKRLPVLPTDVAERFKGFFFEDSQGFNMGQAVRDAMNKRLARSFAALNLPEPGDTRRLTPADFRAVTHFLYDALHRGVEGDAASDLSRLEARLLHEQVERRLARTFRRLKREIEALLHNHPSSFRVSLRPDVDKALEEVFQGSLCQVVDDTNPLAEISLKRKVTLKGPGGIRHTRGMLPGHRQVHATHYGRVCLAETPESEGVGLDLYLALTARVEEGRIKAAFRLKGEATPRWLAFGEEKGHTLLPTTATQDPLCLQEIRLPARRNGRVVEAALGEGTGQDLYPGQMLGIAAGLIPFVQHDDNNRVMMGAKNMKQAVPLLFPEAPLVRTGWERLAAEMSGHALYARRNGTVAEVLGDRLTVRADEGGEDVYPLLPLRPTLHGTIALHRVCVRKGDRVLRGQALADGACTRGGELALGVNLLAAYMPYYGLNFEDGIVISDRLVKEDLLTSLHLRAEEMTVYGDEETVSDEGPELPWKRQLRDWYKDPRRSPGRGPEGLDLSALDGCYVRPGQEVTKGDRLFAKRKREPAAKDAPGDAKNPDTIPHRSSVHGTVVWVQRIPVMEEATRAAQARFKLVCWILQERKVEVGDKLMGRHGNKGVVSRIVPSEEMPHLEDGTPADILLNPHGVISRMNLGQILETHLGWILKHGREKHPDLEIVQPFHTVPEESLREAFQDLGHTGISPEGKAFLWDPRSGERIHAPVTVGYQYILKLNHLVEDKIHARETGALTLITGQPVKGRRRGGGQRLGEMEVWALLAHRAPALLKEFLTLKADAPRGSRQGLTRKYLGASKTDTPFPESLRAAAILLRGLGLDLRFHDRKDEPLDLTGDLIRTRSVSIRVADEETIGRWAQDQEVREPEWPRVVRGGFKPKKQGLFDPSIFKDPHLDMGYIPLREPVPHPIMGGEMTRVPVLPRDFRPLRPGEGGRAVSAALNTLYRDILLADLALGKALEDKATEERANRARTRLERAVHRLMRGDAGDGPGTEKGIAGLVEGKEGIFRMHLLGKRVDASARSVIVPMPELALNEIGVPLEVAVLLLKSKLLYLLSEARPGETPAAAERRARDILENPRDPVHREVLRRRVFDELLKDVPLVLNRAPSLHKYNVLAFRAVHVPHRAIGLHPLVCGMFNADFDGDQMAVHLPLGRAAAEEAFERLSPLRNLVSTSNGQLMLHLTQDIALGIYLYTSDPEGRRQFAAWFEGTVPEPDRPVTGKALKERILTYHRAKGNPAATADLAQRIMEAGFREATLAGVTFSIFDVPSMGPEERARLRAGHPDDKAFEDALRAEIKNRCGL